MANIPDGCVLLARKIQDNPIWYKKPSWWLKVWEYIFMKANHKDNKGFKRGQCFLNREMIYNGCCLQGEGIRLESIDNVIRYLREQSFLTTQKTTRGIIVTICNYDFYQDLNNYRNDTENETGTRQERDRNDSINKNVNNDNNINKNIKGRILNILKKENQKYGLIKISSNKKWNKIYDLCLIRFKDKYTLLDICHAQRGMYKIKQSDKTWWNRKKDLIELLTRGQGKTSNSWIWLDEFKDAYFNEIENTRFELTKKPKESRWF